MKSSDAGAGLAIIADEAVQSADLRPLADLLAAQPPWSDFPIVLLTQRGGGPEHNPAGGPPCQSARQRDVPGTAVPSDDLGKCGQNRDSRTPPTIRGAVASGRAERALRPRSKQRVNDRTAELMTEVAAREQAQERLRAIAEDGNHRPADRRRRARLQQSADGGDGQPRPACASGSPDDARAQRLIDGALQGAQARRGADPAHAGVRAAAGAEDRLRRPWRSAARHARSARPLARPADRA